MASGSKNRTSWIKRLFRTAFKAITQRDEDAPQPQKRRRRGEKEGEGPIMVRPPALYAVRPAARGRYASLGSGPAQRSTIAVGHVEKAALYLADTLDWLQLWQDNTTHWPDDDFSAKQDRYFPQP